MALDIVIVFLVQGVEWKTIREYCYELKSLEWDIRTTLVLSNTRELDRDPFTK